MLAKSGLATSIELGLELTGDKTISKRRASVSIRGSAKLAPPEPIRPPQFSRRPSIAAPVIDGPGNDTHQAVLVGGWDQLDRCLIAAERRAVIWRRLPENTFVFGLGDTRILVFGRKQRIGLGSAAQPAARWNLNGGWKWSREPMSYTN